MSAHKSSAIAIGSAPTVAPSRSRNSFEDVDRLVNSSGLCSVISQRSRDGTLTFAIFRVFQRASTTGEIVEDRTTFIPENLIDSYLAHIQLTMKRIEYLQSHPDELPFERRR